MRITAKRRERDLQSFLYWLSNQKGIHLGKHVGGTWAMQRINSHAFDVERDLAAEYVATTEPPR